MLAGKAFFIKVLSPTGATIVFGGDSASTVVSSPPKCWNIGLDLTGAGERATAVFGQRQGATNQLDRAFDIESPPGSTGLNMKVNASLYRDTKAWGFPATWVINLSNLKPGHSYSIAMDRESSRPSIFYLRDPVRPSIRHFTGSGTYSFTATSTTRTLYIDTGFVL